MFGTVSYLLGTHQLVGLRGKMTWVFGLCIIRSLIICAHHQIFPSLMKSKRIKMAVLVASWRRGWGV